MSRWLSATLFFFYNKMKFEDWPMARSHATSCCCALPNFKFFFFLEN